MPPKGWKTVTLREELVEALNVVVASEENEMDSINEVVLNLIAGRVVDGWGEHLTEEEYLEVADSYSTLEVENIFEERDHDYEEVEEPE